MVNIQFKKIHPLAKLPYNSNSESLKRDAGFDLYAVEDVTIPCQHSASVSTDNINSSCAIVPIGLQLAYITPGYWFRIEARSGLGFKYGITPHFGIIDNEYRNELKIKLYNHGNMNYEIKAGDRIAQMVVYETIPTKLEFVDDIQETDRGEGFGSSGK